MPKGYFPSADAQVAMFTGILSDKLSADPEKYGISPGTAAGYAALAADFKAKLAVALDPPTRTKPAVAAKDAAKRELYAETSRIVLSIRAQRHLSDSDLFDLNLSPRKKRAISTPLPSGVPMIVATSAGPRTISVRLCDGQTKRGALPVGVKGASLFVATGDTEPQRKEDWTFATSVTRTTFALDVSRHLGDAAGTVWICAFWFDNRSRPGPMSAATAVDLPMMRAKPLGNAVRPITLRAA